MIRKHTILSVLFFIGCIFTQAQNIDSLKKVLTRAAEDTNKVNTYIALGRAYVWSYPDSALQFLMPALELSRKINYKSGEIRSLQYLGESLALKGNYSKALEMSLEAVELTEALDHRLMVATHSTAGNVFYYSGDY